MIPSTTPPGLGRLPERLRSGITVDPETGCWLWVRPTRYWPVTARIDGRSVTLRTWIWRALRGALPTNPRTFGRRCHSDRCLNPHHYDVATDADRWALIDRMEEYRRQLGWSARELERAIGLYPDSWSLYRSGDRLPSFPRFQQWQAWLQKEMEP